jgi:hypothetical protein
LRFSDLVEIEEACREDEEQRAGRTIDWISARISRRCAKWLEDWERIEAATAEKDKGNGLRTPWWNELRHCVEGDHVPSKYEGWNHPAASVCFSCQCSSRTASPQSLYSHVGCIYYASQSVVYLGATARSSIRVAFMGRQHTFALLADRPSEEFSTVRRRVRRLSFLRLSRSAHAAKSDRSFQCRQKAVWFT